MRDWSYQAIRKRAEILSLAPGNWDLSIEQLEGKVLETREGEAVYSLGAGALAMEPADVVLGRVRKSASAMSALSEAIHAPGAGTSTDQ